MSALTPPPAITTDKPNTSKTAAPPFGRCSQDSEICKRRDESGHAFCYKRIAAFAAQGIQSPVRNAVTQNAPGIHMPGAFWLAERIYGNTPYRSAPLYLFDKLKFSFLI